VADSITWLKHGVRLNVCEPVIYPVRYTLNACKGLKHVHTIGWELAL
jgi:hypothetical protein